MWYTHVIRERKLGIFVRFLVHKLAIFCFFPNLIVWWAYMAESDVTRADKRSIHTSDYIASSSVAYDVDNQLS